MNDLLEPDRCARLLRALAYPERLEILRTLGTRAHTVSELAEALAIPLVNLSHHLTVLRQAGFVADRKQGRFVVYSLVPGFLDARPDGPRWNLGCCSLEIPSAQSNDG